MASRWLYVSAFTAASLVVACGGTPAASEDERGSVGVPNPAFAYCSNAGFTIVESRCQFPDGTSCEQWAFYRAECGQAHSYCNQHGGSVSSKTEDMGTWTAITAVCDVNGKQCEEASFAKTAKCE